jgi:N-methylhydantoinase B
MAGTDTFKATSGSRKPIPVDSSVIVRTGGGGGWGNPRERDFAAVRHDVLEDYITVEAARELYSVVISADGVIDEAATAQLRS